MKLAFDIWKVPRSITVINYYIEYYHEPVVPPVRPYAIMNAFAVTHEVSLRLGLFAATFVLIAIAEMIAPRRQPTVDKATRWKNNLFLTVINTVAVRIIFPFTAIAVAGFAEERGIGLFNGAPIPFWMAALVALPALDVAIYLQHRVFHAVPVLWRLHRMHHSDLDIDVTTGTRFHTIEILLSMLIKFLVIIVLGAPVISVLIFEILLNATSMFNHGNVHIPAGIERIARWFVVTPDMHRVHHSIDPVETNSNFGFCLPWWDRVLGTYTAQPAMGHEGMITGIAQFRSPQDARLDRMLLQPFIPDKSVTIGSSQRVS